MFFGRARWLGLCALALACGNEASSELGSAGAGGTVEGANVAGAATGTSVAGAGVSAQGAAAGAPANAAGAGVAGASASAAGGGAGAAAEVVGGSAGVAGALVNTTSGVGGAEGPLANDGGAGAAGGAPVNRTSPRVLVFSRTAGYRHDSIEPGIAALRELGAERDWQVTATEDSARFNDAELALFDVVLFLNTTGDVLDSEQEAAFERYIRAGHGYVGVHAASDTEFDWPFYGELVGAYFREHPAIQRANLIVEDATHAATRALPATWTRRDEWYSFRTNPRRAVQVLLSLDEASYSTGSSSMNGDHPIAWAHEYEGTRSFYTALGHTKESYTEPLFLAHLVGGIEWAAGNP